VREIASNPYRANSRPKTTQPRPPTAAQSARHLRIEGQGSSGTMGRPRGRTARLNKKTKWGRNFAVSGKERHGRSPSSSPSLSRLMSTSPRPLRRMAAFRNLSPLAGGSIARVWSGGFGRGNGEERREIKFLGGGVGFCFRCVPPLPLLIWEDWTGGVRWRRRFQRLGRVGFTCERTGEQETVR
jgi:hypothetical protein